MIQRTFLLHRCFLAFRYGSLNHYLHFFCDPAQHLWKYHSTADMTFVFLLHFFRELEYAVETEHLTAKWRNFSPYFWMCRSSWLHKNYHEHQNENCSCKDIFGVDSSRMSSRVRLDLDVSFEDTWQKLLILHLSVNKFCATLLHNNLLI